MANWQEIAIDSFQGARELYRTQHYRSSVSRFYYAAFSLLTHELLKTSFQPNSDRDGPDHAHLAELAKHRLTRFPMRQRTAIAKHIRELYDARINADYKLRTVDERTAKDSRRSASMVFRYLGVSYVDESE